MMPHSQCASQHSTTVQKQRREELVPVPVQVSDVQAALPGAQDDVVGHQVESRHLLAGGEGRQQAAVHRVNMNGVFALQG